MSPVIIDCKGGGRIIINALSTHEVGIQVDNGRGTTGVIASLNDASETVVGIIAAIKAAKP